MSVELRGMNTSTEKPGSSYSGYLILLIILALVVLAAWNLSGNLPPAAAPKLAKITFVGLLVVPLVVLGFLAAGFFMIQPNQAVVITLFGEYRGTERREGLRWLWPWMGRNKLSVRAHNIHSERVKINDLRGNPIEIACNVVWRVADSAQASFDVDDYKQFVNIQIEAGLRTVGSRHPYDDFDGEQTTLRGSADVINHELLEELNDRLKVAGILVDEAGLTSSRLCAGDRKFDASPSAGRGGDRRARQAGDRRGGHGRGRLDQAEPGRDRRARRRAACDDGVQSDGRPVRRARGAAGGQRRNALPVISAPV